MHPCIVGNGPAPVWPSANARKGGIYAQMVANWEMVETTTIANR